MVERGCEAFLTRIMVTGEKHVPITSVLPIGGDVAHVIPKEGAPLPPTRQTKLTIEVLPSDALTFETSHQMLLFEF